MVVFWDAETHSRRNLKECGAHVYAADPSTNLYFFCYAVDDGEVQVWRPGDQVPAPFADPSGHTFVSDNWTFERQILTHILIPRYKFTTIPTENQDCAQRRALASAYPAELGLRCQALGLPYCKDPEARRAMLHLSRPKPDADPAVRDHDLALLLARCKTDVESTRAAYNSPRLRPLSPVERHLLFLDAEINARGITANVPFLKAVQALTAAERSAIDTRLSEITAGSITSVGQVARIMTAVNGHGHAMKTLSKRAVAAVLAHEPDDFTRELLTLRQRGAHADITKRLLAHADPNDHRIRDALRIYGAGPGRWSSPGAQLHGLNRNDAERPASLVNAIMAGDRAELARFGDLLEVTGSLIRAALCAAPGHVLICADFSTIESRVLAWLAGEAWKLDIFQRFDKTKDPQFDLYRVIAARLLRKDVNDISKAERQTPGKGAELSCGFGGSVGAWRRILPDDGRTDAEIKADVMKWRAEHVVRHLGRKRGARHRPLPSGRAINYPGAHLATCSPPPSSAPKAAAGKSSSTAMMNS